MTLYKNLCVPAGPRNSAIAAYVFLGIFCLKTDRGAWRIQLGWWVLWIGLKELRITRSWSHPWIKREMARLLRK